MENKKHQKLLPHIIFYIALFCGFLTTNIVAYATNSDSNIFGPSYNDMENELVLLAEKYPNFATRVIYGHSLKGINLNLLRIAKKDLFIFATDQSRKAVYISGSTHGNEYLNIEDRLPHYFLENLHNLTNLQSFLDAGGVLYIVPVLNPDGYEARTRENSNGTDLNRDFNLRNQNHVAFNEPETKYLTDYLLTDQYDNNLKLMLTVDYHCCMPAFISPWSFTSEKMPISDLISHQDIANIMQTIFGYPYGNSVEIFGKSTGSGIGTSKDYFYETFHSLSFTFEGKEGVENQNFHKHVQFWEEIFKYLNKKQD